MRIATVDWKSCAFPRTSLLDIAPLIRIDCMGLKDRLSSRYAIIVQAGGDQGPAAANSLAI
jgi:hypothetical protein